MELVSVGKVFNINYDASIILDPKYKKAIKGLSEFSHILVVYWFNGADNEKDRNLLVEEKPYKKGPKELGVFATRSPNRPNPIAISVCDITYIYEDKGVIGLSYIDADNETSVLDIKPYTPSIDRIENPISPKWCSHWPKSVETSGDFNWEEEFNF